MFLLFCHQVEHDFTNVYICLVPVPRHCLWIISPQDEKLWDIIKYVLHAEELFLMDPF
jgi:hypothetical protein